MKNKYLVSRLTRRALKGVPYDRFVAGAAARPRETQSSPHRSLDLEQQRVLSPDLPRLPEQ